MFDTQEFEAFDGDARIVREGLRGEDNGVLQGFRETDNGLRESANDAEMSANTHKSSSELAQHFGVTKDSVQDWYKVILQAYYWEPVSKFKIGKGKTTQYTPFCIAAMAELKTARESGQTANDWIANIHDTNADKLQVCNEPAIQPTAEPDESLASGQLAKPEILSQPSPVSALDRIRSDRYNVPEFGSNRLASAQQRASTQRFNLEDTRNRTRQAFMGLAIQTAEELTAEELERQARLEQVYQESYAETLEELQIRNAAKQDAVTDYSVLKQQVMGKTQGQA